MKTPVGVPASILDTPLLESTEDKSEAKSLLWEKRVHPLKDHWVVTLKTIIRKVLSIFNKSIKYKITNGKVVAFTVHKVGG